MHYMLVTSITLPLQAASNGLNYMHYMANYMLSKMLMGSGMDQPASEYRTQLKREKSIQLDRVEQSELTRYHRGSSAWGRGDSSSSSLWVDSCRWHQQTQVLLFPIISFRALLYPLKPIICYYCFYYFTYFIYISWTVTPCWTIFFFFKILIWPIISLISILLYQLFL